MDVEAAIPRRVPCRGGRPDESHAPIHKALKYLEEHSVNGKRITRAAPGRDQFIDFVDCKFVPFTAIDEYFANVERISEILRVLFGPDIEPPVEVSAIRARYLKAFCVLLEIGEGWCIQYLTKEEDFTDDHLHVVSLDKFPVFSIAVREKFMAKRWRFCAHHFEHDHDLDLRLNDSRILPVTSTEILSVGNGVVITKVDIHGDFDHLRPQEADGRHRHTYVLKSSLVDHHDRSVCHKSEIVALSMIRSSDDAYPAEIVRFFGSFTQERVSNIILEYADRGCLEDYLHQTHPPATEEEHISFWTAMKDLTLGLVRLHSITERHRGYHQDLKPQNILVFGLDSNSPFKCRFKVADFGISQIVLQKKPQRSVSGPGRPGVKTYGSPESARAFKYAGRLMTNGQSSDVWSLACIFSVAATWVVGGYNLVQRYAYERINARKSLNLSSADCFHDDTKALPKIEQWHLDLVQHPGRMMHGLTLHLWQTVIQSGLLEDVEARSTSHQFYSAMVRLLEGGGRRLWCLADGDSVPNPTSQKGEDLVGQQQKLHSFHAQPRADSICVQSSCRSSQQDLSVYIQQPRCRSPQEHNCSMRPEHPGRVLFRGSVQNQLAYACCVHDCRSSTLSLLCQQSTRGHDAALSDYFALEHSYGDKLTPPNLEPAPADRPIRNQTGDSRLRQFGEHTMSQQQRTVSESHREMHGGRDGLAHMSVEKLVEYRNPDRSSKHDLTTEAMKDRIKGRKQVFLIDDTKNMRENHWGEVTKLFTGLAHFLDDCDKTGIDLRFTVCSSMNKVSRASKLIPIVKSIGLEVQVSSDPTTPLSNIFQDYKKRIKNGKRRLFDTMSHDRGTPLSITFFTDGIWQAETDLTETIKSMVRYTFDETPTMGHGQVGIQFIRFGGDGKIIRKLDYYDNLHLHAGVSRDIVDTVASDGNVWKMILGPTDKTYDKEGEAGYFCVAPNE